MFDDLFVWMGKISGIGDDKNKPLIYSYHALIIGIAKPGQLLGHHPSLPQYQQATWIFKKYLIMHIIKYSYFLITIKGAYTLTHLYCLLVSSLLFHLRISQGLTDNQ